jgi:HD-GYP domain-containing protein (c-di-GMP phosphodiesterase class II)
MAVADTFTAITEDRPYRAGMNDQQTLDVLDGLVANGGLDGEVVAVLRHEFEVINTTREQRQAQYAVKQKQLMEMMEAVQTSDRGAL